MVSGAMICCLAVTIYSSIILTIHMSQTHIVHIEPMNNNSQITGNI